jgi:hypothetical protein
MAACIPAQPPPNLDATPGAAAVITRDTYRSDLFSVRYPEGWRAITSPAGAPPSVTFAAPGNCPLIVVSSAPVEQPPTCEGKGVRNETRTVMRGGHSFTLAGSTTGALQAEYDAAMQRIEESLESVS